MQEIFFYYSLILTSKILDWSEDLTTSWISERSTFLWTLESKSLTLFEETEIG